MTDVKAWMTGFPVSIGAEASLEEALLVMSERGIRHLPVVGREDRVVGVLSFEDLRAALGNPISREAPPSPQARREALEWRVGDVMSDSPVVARAEEDLAVAADRMADARVGCLPIVDSSGALVGIFSETDALRALAASAWSEQLGAAGTPEEED